MTSAHLIVTKPALIIFGLSLILVIIFFFKWDDYILTAFEKQNWSALCVIVAHFMEYYKYRNFRVFKFSFFFSSANIIIICAGFLNARLCPPREIRKNYPCEYYQIYSIQCE